MRGYKESYFINNKIFRKRKNC